MNQYLKYVGWNISVFMLGLILGAILGLDQQFMNNLKAGLDFCN